MVRSYIHSKAREAGTYIHRNVFEINYTVFKSSLANNCKTGILIVFF